MIGVCNETFGCDSDFGAFYFTAINWEHRRFCICKPPDCFSTVSVEMIAVMAKYSPFAENAGMQKVAEQQTVQSVSMVSKAFLELGFDLQLLSSKRSIRKKLEILSLAQVTLLKEAFVKSKHTRFKKEFAVSRHQPFGKTSDYIESLRNADNIKMTRLIKIAGILLQTKAYLIWKKQKT